LPAVPPGDPQQPEHLRPVTLPACKAIVACSLDLTPETLSRERHPFDKEGLLSVQRRTIQVFDSGRLQQAAFWR
jgi:hypothetical protein